MKKEPVIVHILANGKHVKDIKGHVIPAENPVYEIIYKGAKEGKCLNCAG